MRSLSGSFLILFLFVINLNFVSAQTAVVKFEVKIPAESKSSKPNVFLAGSFNCWNPHDSLYIMKKTGDNSYSLEVPVFDGHKYEYKYTLGSWETVETSLEGKQIKNRTMISRTGEIVSDTVYKWNSPDTSQKNITTNMSKEQMEALSGLKNEISTKLEVKIKSFVEVLKKANENMLSENPDMDLKKQYHKEIIAGIDSTVTLAFDLMWKISSALTPEQKKEILAEMQNTDDPGVLFNWISKAMETPQK